MRARDSQLRPRCLVSMIVFIGAFVQISISSGKACLMVLSGHSKTYEPSSSLRKRPISVLPGPLLMTLTERRCCGSPSLLELLAAAKVSASDCNGLPADASGPVSTL